MHDDEAIDEDGLAAESEENEGYDSEQDEDAEFEQTEHALHNRNLAWLAIGIFLVLVVLYTIATSPNPTITPNGQTSQEQGPTNESIAALERAAAEFPKQAEVWINLGNAYYDSQQWDKAVESYKKALEITPDNPGVRVDMAVAYYSTGQTQIAVDEVKKTIKAYPDFAPAYYNLGVMLSMQGKKSDAISSFETYIRLEPTGDMVNDAKTQIQSLKSQ